MQEYLSGDHTLPIYPGSHLTYYHSAIASTPYLLSPCYRGHTLPILETTPYLLTYYHSAIASTPYLLPPCYRVDTLPITTLL